jgi:hypothetical protein
MAVICSEGGPAVEKERQPVVCKEDRGIEKVEDLDSPRTLKRILK